MPNKVATRAPGGESRERPEKGTDSRDSHNRGDVDTRNGGRREGDRANQGHRSEPEHGVPSKRDETVEDK
jgi:hypothetical protein